MATERKQLSLWRSPKHWPLQTVEALLAAMELSIQDPYEAKIAAIIRTSVQSHQSDSWAGQTGSVRRGRESVQYKPEQTQAKDTISQNILEDRKRA